MAKSAATATSAEEYLSCWRGPLEQRLCKAVGKALAEQPPDPRTAVALELLREASLEERAALSQAAAEQEDGPQDDLAGHTASKNTEAEMRKLSDEKESLKNEIQSLKDQLNSVSTPSASATSRDGNTDACPSPSPASPPPLKKAPAGTKQKKPCVVISYKTENTAQLNEVGDLLKGVGFDTWNGSMVKGGADWKDQWLDMVEKEDVKLIIFLLSEKFTQSPACQDEFHWVFQRAELRSKALPVLLEDFKLPRKFQFSLTNVNYVQPGRDWLEHTKNAAKKSMEDRELDKEFHGVFGWGTPQDSFRSDGSRLDEYGRQDAMVKMLSDRAQRLRNDAKRDASPYSKAQVRLMGVIGSTNFKYSMRAETSKAVCKLLGTKLAKIPAMGSDVTLEVALVTGGCSGVGALVAREFHATRLELGRKASATGTYAVLPSADNALSSIAGVTVPLAIDGETVWEPEADGSTGNYSGKLEGQLGFGKWDEAKYGQTLQVGETDRQRKRFLAEALPILIFIEGGPGATFEAISSLAKGHAVLPIGCLGGGASDFATENAKKLKKIFDTANAPSMFDEIQDENAVNDIEALTDKVVTLVTLAMQKQQAFDVGIAIVGGKTSSGAFNLQESWRELPETEQKVVTVLDSHSVAALGAYIRDNGGSVVLIDGHGTRNLFKNMGEKEFEEKLAPVVAHLNTICGKGQWMAMYGGDPYDPKKVDASFIVYALHKFFGIKVIATQVEDYGGGILSRDALDAGKGQLTDAYPHLKGGAVMLYRPTMRENMAGQKEIVYGGLDESGQPIGVTEFWYADGVRRYVKAHLFMGGGTVSLENAKWCLKHGLRVLYIPCAAKHVPEDERKPNVPEHEQPDWYGQVHAYFLRPQVAALVTEKCRHMLIAAPAKPVPFIELMPKAARDKKMG